MLYGGLGISILKINISSVFTKVINWYTNIFQRRFEIYCWFHYEYIMTIFVNAFVLSIFAAWIPAPHYMLLHRTIQTETPRGNKTISFMAWLE